MKAILNQTLQFLLFLLIGASIFYWLYKDQDWNQLSTILTKADYQWIWLSLVFGVLSHVARAVRWHMLISATCIKVKGSNVLMAVFTGYLGNLVLPRMGEVTRCGMLSKYNRAPFAVLAGTVAAERLSDIFALLLIIVSALFLEYHLLGGFLSENISLVWILDLFTSVWWWVLMVTLVVAGWFLVRFAKRLSAFRKFKELWSGFANGFRSLKNLRSKKLYILYSFIIWGMYLLMQYTCFFAFAETSSLTLTAGLVILATGSLGMLAPVQGGVGTWHGMVIATLALYGVTSEPAYAFALLVHGAQNLLVVVGGLISLLVLPLTNPNHSQPIEPEAQ